MCNENRLGRHLPTSLEKFKRINGWERVIFLIADNARLTFLEYMR
jgi:hypothetical protein